MIHIEEPDHDGQGDPDRGAEGARLVAALEAHLVDRDGARGPAGEVVPGGRRERGIGADDRAGPAAVAHGGDKTVAEFVGDNIGVECAIDRAIADCDAFFEI